MRYLAWFTLPFSAAVFLACKLPVWWLCGPALVVTLVSALLIQRRCGKPIKARLALAGICAGLLWFGLYSAVNVAPHVDLNEQQYGFTATVLSYPEETESGVSVKARLESGGAKGERVLLFVSGAYSRLCPGDQLTGTAKLTATVPADRTYYSAQGDFLIGSVSVSGTYHAGKEDLLRYLPQRLARGLKQTIAELLPGDPGALLQGLLTGDRSALPDTVYSDFRRSGMAHLLAVSGLHVSFLTGILYALPGSGRRRIFVAIPVLILFALMTGGQPSVWRAVVMSLLVLVAPLFYRETDPVTSLAAALFLLLVQNPYAAESVSLQLSFAAVAGMACCNERLYRWMIRPLQIPRRANWFRRIYSRLWKLLAGSFSVSFSAMIFTLPLMAWYFKTVSVLAPISNLLSIWVTSVAFALGVATCLAAWMVPAVAAVLSVPLRWCLQWLLAVAESVGTLPFAAMRLDNHYYTGWFVVTLILIALTLLVKRVRRRPVVPIAVSALLLIIALVARAGSLSTPNFSVTALDVGQGACTVMASRGNYVAVDCGGYEAGDVLADHICSGGDTTLQLLVLTHYDSDHVDGVEQLLRRVRVECIALPDVLDSAGNREEIVALAQARGVPVRWVRTNTQVSFGEAVLTIYAPVSDRSDNGSGIAVLGTWRDRAVLVTGDYSKAEELALLEREDLPELDVLVVGHHGSSNSTADSLLAALRPQNALISVGDNHYGLPSEQTLGLLNSYHCGIYRTDRDGSVTIRFTEE